MSSYHGRIMNLQIDPENVLDGWTEGELRAYKYGHRNARHNAAVLGNEADIELHTAAHALDAADARIAELEAALGRIAGFDCRAPYSLGASCGRCESCVARAALATPDAGAATGNAPRSGFQRRTGAWRKRHRQPQIVNQGSDTPMDIHSPTPGQRAPVACAWPGAGEGRGR